jgi:hypothetical protein
MARKKLLRLKRERKEERYNYHLQIVQRNTWVTSKILVEEGGGDHRQVKVKFSSRNQV